MSNWYYSSSAIFYMQLTGIKTSSPRCKTKAGVGIGSEKLKTIAAYEDSSLRLQPDLYEIAPSKSTITVYDYHDTRFITFYLENKKVIAMETGIHFRDSE